MVGEKDNAYISTDIDTDMKQHVLPNCFEISFLTKLCLISSCLKLEVAKNALFCITSVINRETKIIIVNCYRKLRSPKCCL